MQFAPSIIVPFLAWRIYVRVRPHRGRHELRPAGLALRLALGCGVATAGMLLAADHLLSLQAGFAGVLAGALLALLGLRWTRWEMTPEGNFYTPNAFLGLGLVLLLIGRFVNRFTALCVESAAPAAGLDRFFCCPITLAIFGVTLGYHLAYIVGVLARGRRVA